MISCSSGDRQFRTLLKKADGYKLEGLSDIRPWSIFSGEKVIRIYNGGFPVNFLVENADPVEETVPTQDIQITRGIKLVAIVQALKLLELLNFAGCSKTLSTATIKLNPDYQHEILCAYLNKEPDISVQKIAQASIGDSQPTLEEFLNRPDYVVPDYYYIMRDTL